MLNNVFKGLHDVELVMYMIFCDTPLFENPWSAPGNYVLID